MKIRIIITGITLILLLALFGCEDYSEIDPPSLDPGQIDLTRYVAVGNSLTSGLQNNSLYKSGQRYSFPNLLAQQLSIEDFEQPLIDDPGIPSRMRVQSIEPFVVQNDPPNPTLLNAQLQRPYNNLGIPGSLILDVADTTDFAQKANQRDNPFFQIVLRNKQFGNSIIEQAINLQPTLLTFWLGSSDILAYVVSGGETTPPTAANPQIFTAIYSQVAQILASYAGQSGATVILANIPDLKVIPFVNTVPPVIINPETGQPVTDPEGDPIFYIGISPGDKLLLTALEFINQGYGIPEALNGNGRPLPNHVVLSVSQQQFVDDRIQRFNQTIETLAQTYSFGLVDINARINEIKEQGYKLGEMTLTTDFVTGGIFSLDGVHLTSWGNALVTNEFLTVMNRDFGASFPLIDIGTIPPSIELVTADIDAPTKYKRLFEIDATEFKNIVNLYTSF